VSPAPTAADFVKKSRRDMLFLDVVCEEVVLTDLRMDLDRFGEFNIPGALL
jgi:hypothetical protein